MSSNNFKTKEMFFGQYFGQKVFCDSSVGLENKTYQDVYHFVGDMSETSFVKLKSIEDISDEDAIRVAQLTHQIDGVFSIGEIITTSKKPIPYIAIVDFLRSKGYAIPYNGLSVDVLVSFGWVVLR